MEFDFKKEDKKVSRERAALRKTEINSRIAYIDQTDFIHELGCAGGIVLHPSVQGALDESGCVKECGLYKVKVSLLEVVLPAKFDRGWSFDEIESKGARYIENLKERISTHKAHVESLKEKISWHNDLAEKLEGELKELGG